VCDELRSGENPGVCEPKVRDIPVALALVSNLKVILKFIRLCRKVEDDIGITLDRKTVPRGGVRKCQIVKYDLVSLEKFHVRLKIVNKNITGTGTAFQAPKRGRGPELL